MQPMVPGSHEFRRAYHLRNVHKMQEKWQYLQLKKVEMPDIIEIVGYMSLYNARIIYKMNENVQKTSQKKDLC